MTIVVALISASFIITKAPAWATTTALVAMTVCLALDTREQWLERKIMQLKIIGAGTEKAAPRMSKDEPTNPRKDL